jgi:hypothetical protein
MNEHDDVMLGPFSMMLRTFERWAPFIVLFTELCAPAPRVNARSMRLC